jgi:predicted CXXCH cytochrome family protein
VTPRRASIGGAIVGAAALLVIACAEPARYRVLSFFFDGVPRPGEEQPRGYASGGTVMESDSVGPAADRPPPQPVLPHAPYKENRCSTCHDLGTGLLVQTPERGLCQRCHENVPGELRFLHGPVAVNGCLACHHPHGSIHEELLLADAKTLCYRCHARDELTTGAHHATLDTQLCTDCHAAHGGDDRFFLKQANVDRGE